MTVAFASYQFKNNDLAFNRLQIEKNMQHAQGRADMVCFGEAFLQGFDAFNWYWEQDKDIAMSQDNGMVGALCALAEK